MMLRYPGTSRRSVISPERFAAPVSRSGHNGRYAHDFAQEKT